MKKILSFVLLFMVIHGLGESLASSVEAREYVNIEGTHTLKKNNLVGVLSKLKVKFNVFFSIKLNSFSDGYKSVLHLTMGEDNEKYGDRIPGVWIYNQRLYVVFAINGNKNSFFTSKPLKLGQWTHISITQDIIRGKTKFGVYINYGKEYEVENFNAQEFTNVKIYFGDPWYEAQDGLIKNFWVNEIPDKVKKSLKKDAIQKKKFGPEF
ncbi:uncharacterized protein LOC100200973 [Hydra vulgaris]|uniref:uncharacterized protein LOC100200973 n=1 Tax=Hydra vulgaris TaxID=6087 RepID=UPI0001924B31|nr:uncharacterized protein LOC100200973 [Hydra vulgaris]